MRTKPKLFWVVFFSAAMAYLEAAVVVYLRIIYYPQGFVFPLTEIPAATFFIEVGREAATLIMLAAIGCFCGRSKLERFGYLLLAFGIWDIMYYVWLKIFIGWPASLLTWDVLFLIPVPWVGPVLAPLLVSFTLIGAGFWIVLQEEREPALKFSVWAWWGEILAGFIIILSFLWEVRNIVSGGLPRSFRWDIFSLGLSGGIVLFVSQARRLLHPIKSA